MLCFRMSANKVSIPRSSTGLPWSNARCLPARIYWLTSILWTYVLCTEQPQTQSPNSMHFCSAADGTPATPSTSPRYSRREATHSHTMVPLQPLQTTCCAAQGMPLSTPLETQGCMCGRLGPMPRQTKALASRHGMRTQQDLKQGIRPVKL